MTPGKRRAAKLPEPVPAPRSDIAGKYELLLASTCPFCGARVYLACLAGELEITENLFAMHREDPDNSPACAPFYDALREDPHAATRAVMERADPGELDAFLAKTASLDRTLN